MTIRFSLCASAGYRPHYTTSRLSMGEWVLPLCVSTCFRSTGLAVIGHMIRGARVWARDHSLLPVTARRPLLSSLE